MWKKKAIDTISNAYRVYKFNQTINNRINKKNSLSKSPSIDEIQIKLLKNLAQSDNINEKQRYALNWGVSRLLEILKINII